MKSMTTSALSAVIGIAAISLGVIFPTISSAHCDTLDGPVVTEARVALEKGDVTPVLKWVKAANENEIKTVFKKTLAARSSGKEAREIAELYFFEALVRLHRAGEGAAFTGLAPRGQLSLPWLPQTKRSMPAPLMKSQRTSASLPKRPCGIVLDG